MLNVETRRKIDILRDTLVGKIPVPTEQVKQITLAMIYKFMGDIDAENKSLGGTSFFTGDYTQYSWNRILDRSRSAYDRVMLYSEGLEKMSMNKNIPQLFRDIFKGAFLPFRDPAIVDQFLKGINEFQYEHSEELGNSFEYLLMVMGAQGDAGQFRTPRHIIDFIVKIVNPQKTDSILDPACGTAGFLISAYKHIIENNIIENEDSGKQADTKRRKKPLSIKELRDMTKNFTGYDISHDMVRLSAVNMYLHQFPDPKICEYDTLTSLDKWDDCYDCILANPPFMTPKGGIKPHNKFSVNANRSEVLFVDYIMEHLNPNGRAGVIVPEGIIFQSGNAYKELRRMLVDDNYLWAVVSLPSGIFQPYSGVKTSVLLMDKTIAKKTDKILFVKIENDGFDLGAQRKPIDKDDLPQAFEISNKYKVYAQSHQEEKIKELLSNEKNKKYAHAIDKAKIAESGDYILSGDRYKETLSVKKQKWPMIKLAEMAIINPDKKEFKNADKNTIVSFVPMADIKSKTKYFEYKIEKPLHEVLKGYTYFKNNDILLAKITPCFENGKAGIANKLKNDIGFGSTEFIVIRPLSTVLSEWIYYFISNDDFLKIGKENMTGSAGQQRLSIDFLKNYSIPFPPIEIQQKIVEEIDGYQKIIDGARQVVENYRLKINIDDTWSMSSIGDICSLIQYGISEKMNEQSNGYKTFRMNELINGIAFDNGNMKCSDISAEEFEKYKLRKGDLLFNRTNSFEHVGRTGIFNLDGEYCFASYLIRLSILPDKANSFFINYYMNTETFQKGIKQYASKAIGQSNINATSLRNYLIPIPPLKTQQKIVDEISEEKRIIDANRRLIEIFEKKIKDKIDDIF